MKIIISFLSGKKFTVEIIDTQKIEDLKQIIEKRENIKYDQQRIIFNGKTLLDESILKDNNIKDGDKLYLILLVRGGGLIVPCHNLDKCKDMNKMDSDLEFSTSAPCYRVMNRGMCFEVVCTDKTCEWHNCLAICNVGYGKFILSETFKSLDCKYCGGKITQDNIKRIGFCYCSYEFQYSELKNSSKIIKSKLIDVPEKPCFLDGEIGDAKYINIIFTVYNKEIKQ